DRHDLAFLRFLFGGIGDDDPARGLFFFLDALHDDSVLQRTNVHDFFASLLPSASAASGPWQKRYSEPRGPGKTAKPLRIAARMSRLRALRASGGFASQRRAPRKR